jgi:hypothetical protein
MCGRADREAVATAPSLSFVEVSSLLTDATIWLPVYMVNGRSESCMSSGEFVERR